MTTEDRVLKLENAFSTLAQLAAESNERTSTLAQLAAQSNERTSNLEQNHQTLERSIEMLVELAQVQSSRIDDGDERQRQTDAHLDVLGQRITELAVASDERQRQTDAHLDVLGQRITELAVAQAKTEGAMSELAAAHTQTETALVALTARVGHLSETVERYISGKGDE